MPGDETGGNHFPDSHPVSPEAQAVIDAYSRRPTDDKISRLPTRLPTAKRVVGAAVVVGALGVGAAAGLVTGGSSPKSASLTEKVPVVNIDASVGQPTQFLTVQSYHGEGDVHLDQTGVCTNPGFLEHAVEHVIVIDNAGQISFTLQGGSPTTGTLTDAGVVDAKDPAEAWHGSLKAGATQNGLLVDFANTGGGPCS